MTGDQGMSTAPGWITQDSGATWIVRQLGKARAGRTFLWSVYAYADIASGGMKLSKCLKPDSMDRLPDKTGEE